MAIAGADLTARVGETVELDGASSSDRDGDPLTFRWTLQEYPEGSQTNLTGESAPTTSFVPDVAGTYRITLVTSDGKDESVPDSVLVTVTQPRENRPPIAVVGSNMEVAVGTSVTLDGSESSDPDGDPLMFDWVLEQSPSGSTAAITDTGSETPTFQPDLPGPYDFSLVVFDGKLESPPARVTITGLAAGNRAPIADAGSDQSVSTGTTVQLDGTNSADPDGSPLTHAWSIADAPAGSAAVLSDATSSTPSFVADLDGTWTLELVVHDGELSSSPDTVVVIAATGNRSPIAHAGADVTVGIGETVTLDGTGSSDPDGDSLNYAWSIDTKPSGSTATITGDTQARPTFGPDRPGDYEISLVVSDGAVQSPLDRVVVTATEPRPTAAGDIVLTEVMADPSALSDTEGEWFEFYNDGATDLALGGCTLTDEGTDSHTITSLTVPAGGYATSSRGQSPGFTPDYVHTGQFVLGNSGDEIILTCDGVVIAHVAYASASSGVSRALLRSKMTEIANDEDFNWCEASTEYHDGDLGTPGQPNDFDQVCP